MKIFKYWQILYLIFIIGNSPAAHADTGIDGSATTSSSFTLTGPVVMSSVTVTSGTISNLIAANLTSSTATISNLTVSNLTGVFLGKLKQVQSASTTTTYTTTSNSFSSTSLTLNITPSLSTSKILVFASGTLDDPNTSLSGAYATINGTTTGNLGDSTQGLCHLSGSVNVEIGVPCTMIALDSPGTTSAQTYTVQLKSQINAKTSTWGNAEKQVIIAAEILQ